MRIYYNMDEKQYITRPDIYFDGVYELEWFEDPFVKKIVKDIDKSEVISPRLIDSPVLGPIGPRNISGGTKTLILMYKLPDEIFNASSCGDNCAKWILEISKLQDITINLNHIMDFGPEPFEAIFSNDDSPINGMRDLVGKIVYCED